MMLDPQVRPRGGTYMLTRFGVDHRIFAVFALFSLFSLFSLFAIPTGDLRWLNFLGSLGFLGFLGFLARQRGGERPSPAHT